MRHTGLFRDKLYVNERKWDLAGAAWGGRGGVPGLSHRLLWSDVPLPAAAPQPTATGRLLSSSSVMRMLTSGGHRSSVKLAGVR